MLTKLYVNINSNLAEPGGQAEQTINKTTFWKKQKPYKESESLPPLD